MRIGIDIDNTICNTDEYIDKYESIFLKEENIDSIREGRVLYLEVLDKYINNNNNKYKIY